MNAYLQALVDSPIDTAERANKLFLPEGRKPAARAGKVKTEPAPGDLTPKQVKEKAEREQAGKMKAVLDYYAGTSVPFDRIAAHTGIPLNRIAECMQERGRVT